VSMILVTLELLLITSEEILRLELIPAKVTKGIELLVTSMKRIQILIVGLRIWSKKLENARGDKHSHLRDLVQSL
jgi:hypothetical protein